MYDPRFRLALLLSTIIAVVTAIMCVRFYLYEGLNWTEYFLGIAQVGGSILFGFLFVWGSVKLMTYERDDMKGFEATYVDETGTGFNFPVRLSKFIPDIITAPFSRKISPLESELMGFLDGYRHWPYDIDAPEKGSLYNHAIRQWKAMRKIKGATALHRAAALGQDIGLTYAYKEKRKTHHPFKEFWIQDDVSFSRRCAMHGGLSTTIIATMPAFRELGDDDETNQRYRRALLTAIRYRDNPISIPANCDPLAKDIYEALHKSARLIEIATNKEEALKISDDDINTLHREMKSYFQAIITDLDVNPTSIRTESDGVYIGDGKVAVRMNRFLQKLGVYMSPQTRNRFDLWNIGNQPTPAWTHILQGLYKQGVLIQEWDGMRPRCALFNLNIGAVTFNQSIILDISRADYPELRSSLDSYPAFVGVVETQKDNAAILQEVRSRAAAVDNMIKKVHDSVRGT